jgi:predicted LPLAT superfamily acyltransferase
MAYVARLKQEYRDKVIPALTEEFGYKNVMEVPKLKKIVISKGVGAAVADKKLIDHAVDELTKISGQKAVSTLSKKDVASFKLRKGMPIGVRVTLRGEQMYEFLDRLVTSGRTTPVTLLGGTIEIPTAPYLLASLLGCPLFFMVALREAGGRYRVFAEVLAENAEAHRADRERRIAELAAAYAARLEHHTLRFPYQWFNFFDPWSATSEDPEGSE